VRSIAGVGVVAMPVRTTLKRLPLVVVVVVVAAGRDEPTMEGDCADVASTTKILLNFHSSHPILRLKKKNSKLILLRVDLTRFSKNSHLHTKSITLKRSPERIQNVQRIVFCVYDDDTAQHTCVYTTSLERNMIDLLLL
jgi:hypothetical protein